ncbi:HAD hydrolase-like protein [Photobacterium nomapromontoriensis]|uniref:HAD hydrolase-like protein n=1 Tax=Photobacterium nomapromontoriensis TaxID=2910237 RepID=UPI003D1044AE
MNLFLIDIDGALVNSEKIDWACYSQAVKDVLGIEMDMDLSNYTNLTDAGVLDAIIVHHGVTASRSLVHRQVETRYIALINEELHSHPDFVSAIQGAQDFLLELRSRKDTHIAVATGGWESAAKLKLRAVGIDLSDVTFTSSSDALSRTEIMALAAFRAKQDSGYTFERRIVFGHGERNKYASQELGYEYVEVGASTGNHTHIPNLAHYQAVLSRLSLH